MLLKLHGVRIIDVNDTDMKYKANGTNVIYKFVLVYGDKFHHKDMLIVKSGSFESVNKC